MSYLTTRSESVASLPVRGPPHAFGALGVSTAWARGETNGISAAPSGVPVTAGVSPEPMRFCSGGVALGLAGCCPKASQDRAVTTPAERTTAAPVRVRVTMDSLARERAYLTPAVTKWPAN